MLALFVAGVTAAATIAWLAHGVRTNGSENLLLQLAHIRGAAFLTAFAVERVARQAAVLAAFAAAIVVGTGFALLYYLYSNLCGPSNC